MDSTAVMKCETFNQMLTSISTAVQQEILIKDESEKSFTSTFILKSMFRK